MSSSAKPSSISAARRKSSKPTKFITLKLSPKLLRKFAPSPSTSAKEDEKPSKEETPASSTPQPSAADATNGDAKAESTTNAPSAADTPSSSMPPPTEIVKKKPGRKSAVALDPNAPPKVRGKPGPKKKARLEDGTIDHSAPVPRAANAHRLGPRANQGAINAGLRALDRSGKPCRRWAKDGFKMKSFTGVMWEIPRWKAPPKISTEVTPETQSTSGDSSKENKENSQLPSVKSEKSNSAGDVEMSNAQSNNVPSPASSLPAVPADVAMVDAVVSAAA